MPDILLLDIPPAQRGSSLLLDRWYPIILESSTELAEMKAFLAMPRPMSIAPDLFDHRPSAGWATGVAIIRYDPPAAGWPLLIVCRWPDTWAQRAASEGFALARGCYTTEAFATESAAEAHVTTLLASLARDHDLEVRLISGDRLGAAGRA